MVMAVPTLLYSREIWLLNKKDYNSLIATEMFYLKIG